MTERLDNIGNVLLVREYYGFYNIPEQDRYNILDFEKVFGNVNPITLEIGCGKGKFANDYASKHPDKNVLAVEKISNVILDACVLTENSTLKNIKYLNCGAENLLYYLKENTVQDIYLNFSTPYPKKRHATHRLTHERFLNIYKKLLVDGGKIYIKTDNVGLFLYSKESLTENGFKLLEVTEDLHKNGNPDGNIVTEYESKFVNQGLPIMRLVAVKE